MVVPAFALKVKSVVDAWKMLPPVKVLLVVVENARPFLKKLDADVVENERPAAV